MFYDLGKYAQSRGRVEVARVSPHKFRLVTPGKRELTPRSTLTRYSFRYISPYQAFLWCSCVSWKQIERTLSLQNNLLFEFFDIVALSNIWWLCESPPWVIGDNFAADSTVRNRQHPAQRDVLLVHHAGKDVQDGGTAVVLRYLTLRRLRHC